MWDLQNILQGLNIAILFWNIVLMITLMAENERVKRELEREKEARKGDTIDTTLNGLLN